MKNNDNENSKHNRISKANTVVPALCLLLSLTFCQSANANYGSRVCKLDGFKCVTVGKGQTWQSMFPNASERNIVKRINRMNIRIGAGSVIAVPHNLSGSTIFDYAPFASTRPADGRKTIVVSQKQLAWGAFDSDGRLVNWGPIASGKDYCPDVHRGCKTPPGTYTVQRKQGEGCISTKFPVGKGGAKMPYCMFFHGGYALHGSFNVPGHRDSHGCVRMYPEDAKWLNENFVNVGKTRVIVQPL